MSYPKLFSNAEYSDSFIYLPWAWLELQTYLNPNPARHDWKDCIWIWGNQRCNAQGILARSDSPGNVVCSWIQYFHVGVDCKKIAARRLVITLVIRVAFEEEGEYSTAWILIQSQDWPQQEANNADREKGRRKGNESIHLFILLSVSTKSSFTSSTPTTHKSFHHYRVWIELRHNQSDDTIPFIYHILCYIIMPPRSKNDAKKGQPKAPREKVSLQSQQWYAFNQSRSEETSHSLISL